MRSFKSFSSENHSKKLNLFKKYDFHFGAYLTQGCVFGRFLWHSISYLIRIWPVFDQNLTRIWSAFDEYLTTSKPSLVSIWSAFYQYLTSIWSVFYQYLVSIWSVFGDAVTVFDQYLISFDQYLTSTGWVFDDVLAELDQHFSSNLITPGQTWSNFDSVGPLFSSFGPMLNIRSFYPNLIVCIKCLKSFQSKFAQVFVLNLNLDEFKL